MDQIQSLAVAYVADKSDKNFKKLIDRLEPGLRKYIFKITRDNDLCNDAYLQCITKVYKKIDQYNDHYQFSTWVYRIARNEALHLLTENKNTVSLNAMIDDNQSDHELRSASVDPYDEMDQNEEFQFDDERREKYQRIVEGIYTIETIYADILLDREVENMSYDELSKKYDITLAAVKTRLYRARKILSEKLGISSINEGLQEYHKVIFAV